MGFEAFYFKFFLFVGPDSQESSDNDDAKQKFCLVANFKTFAWIRQSLFSILQFAQTQLGVAIGAN